MIVYFYPAAMTPGCTKQACDFSESLDSLRGAGYEVLGVSKDKPAKLAKFRERDALTLTLLSDEDLAVHQAYGAFGTKKLYGKEVEGVIRSTFVIDEAGTVELAQYNVKATGHVAKLRRDLGLRLTVPASPHVADPRVWRRVCEPSATQSGPRLRGPEQLRVATESSPAEVVERQTRTV